jgi:hypothetical protein
MLFLFLGLSFPFVILGYAFLKKRTLDVNECALRKRSAEVQEKEGRF